jgi:BirA family biotin operon repressor/biotin-[acetyl-CoA-carboxylase] ligase
MSNDEFDDFSLGYSGRQGKMNRPKILHMGEVNSTNDLAKDLLRNDDREEWDMILADHQTKGRGQRENIWISGSGQNLTMSLILRPPILKALTPWEISMAIALAVRDLIDHETNRECLIKWPNDIIIADKKIAGILIENIWAGDAIQYSVLGVGLNLRQRDFGNVKTAISLSAFKEKISDPICYGNDIFTRLIDYLISENRHEIIEQYQRFLYRRYEAGGVALTGEMMREEVLGVTPEGLLITKDWMGMIFERNHPEARILYRNTQ